MAARGNIFFALAVLFAINALNFFDRQILGAVAEPVREEFGLSDSALGFVATAFTLLYAAVGLPLGRLADRVNRSKILAVGVFVWSLLTAASGLARTYFQLVALRLGVGVGEATCAPASTSLIGDLFSAGSRARALSVFMMGLPVGTALSYAVTGTIAYYYDWRTALFVAGIPGILCALAVVLVREPARGATEERHVGRNRRDGSPYLLVLSIPTMRWLIASGALQNFNMYALGTFLPSFLRRVHHYDIREAGFIVAAVYGAAGIPGLILGGMAGDAVLRRHANGRLLIGAVAILVSVPLVYLALIRPTGDTLGFLVFMGLGCAMMYVYYSTVYATIHDVIEPSLRGTAMALYFCAMYALGGSFGAYGTGLASDWFTLRAAQAAGVASSTVDALEPFRAEGLHSAMYIIPLLNIALAVVLFAASHTVTADVGRLRTWIEKLKEVDESSALTEVD